jgi:hypothetical protein
MAGLFAFHFISGALTQGAKSVVGGGRLILNTAFPRTLLPLSAVLTSFLRFLPCILVYAVMHTIRGAAVRAAPALGHPRVRDHRDLRGRRDDARRGPAGLLPRRLELSPPVLFSKPHLESVNALARSSYYLKKPEVRPANTLRATSCKHPNPRR